MPEAQEAVSKHLKCPLEPCLRLTTPNGHMYGSSELLESSTITKRSFLKAEGPYTIYLASCGSGACDSVNTGSVKWFKIYELGLVNGTVYKGTWANGQLMADLK